MTTEDLQGQVARSAAVERELREQIGKLREELAEAKHRLAEIEDIDICRLQLPDGRVPGGTVECARMWHAEAQRFWKERDEARLMADAARNNLDNERKIIEGDKEQWRRAIQADRARAERWREMYDAQCSATSRETEDNIALRARATAAERERDGLIRQRDYEWDRRKKAQAARAAAESALAEARGALNRDRTGLAAGLAKVQRIVGGYRWLGNGEWGSYSWEERTEKTLRAEIATCLDQINVAAGVALNESGKLANVAVRAADAALARAGEQGVVMVPSLPVDEAADARMADLRKRQPPEAKRQIAGEPASSGQEVDCGNCGLGGCASCDAAWRRHRESQTPATPPPGEQGKGGGEGLALARIKELLETLPAPTGHLLAQIYEIARLAPARPAEHPGDALRAEVLRLAGEFQKAGSEYERGGSASGAAQMRRVSNLLYGLGQDGTGLVFTPVPGDEPAEHPAKEGRRSHDAR